MSLLQQSFHEFIPAEIASVHKCPMAWKKSGTLLKDPFVPKKADGDASSNTPVRLSSPPRTLKKNSWALASEGSLVPQVSPAKGLLSFIQFEAL